MKIYLQQPPVVLIRENSAGLVLQRDLNQTDLKKKSAAASYR